MPWTLDFLRIGYTSTLEDSGSFYRSKENDPMTDTQPRLMRAANEVTCTVRDKQTETEQL